MSSVSVGSGTAVAIVDDAPDRFSIIIVNTHSSADLYIDSSSTMTTATGIKISAGSNFTEDSGGEKVYCGPIYGLAGENVIDVRYWERTR